MKKIHKDTLNKNLKKDLIIKNNSPKKDYNKLLDLILILDDINSKKTCNKSK